MKRFYAVLEMKIRREIEFSANPADDLETIATEYAIQKFGNCEEIDILELDYAVESKEKGAEIEN